MTGADWVWCVLTAWCLSLAATAASPAWADNTPASGTRPANGRTGAATTIAGDQLRLGEIVSLRHPVTIHRGDAIGGTAPGAEAYVVDTLHNGDWIYDGDWIETGAGGHVEFILGNQGRMRLGERARLQLASEPFAVEGNARTGLLVHGYLRQGVLRARVRLNRVTPLTLRFHAQHAQLTLSRGDLVLQGHAMRMDACVRLGAAEFACIVQGDGSMGGVQRLSVGERHRLAVSLPVQVGTVLKPVAMEKGCPVKPELVFTLEQETEMDAVPIQRRPDLDGA